MNQAVSFPSKGKDDNGIREDVVKQTRPILTVIARGKRDDDKTASWECEYVKNQAHNILFFRPEIVLLNMLKYMSDTDLEDYLQSSVQKEDFSAIAKRIRDMVRYLLWKWEWEYGSTWTTSKSDMRHFMGNYFSWCPLSYLLRQDYVNMVTVLRFIDALYHCKDMYPIFKNSRKRLKRGKFDATLWAEAQMIRLGLKEKTEG